MAANRTTPVRLHRNQGGYCGERIVIGDVLQRLRTAAGISGWTIQEIMVQDDLPVWLLVKPPAVPVLVPRIYISAGIHGDEPAGTLAALRLIEENQWPAQAEIVMFPCLNPAGMAQNRREGPEGRDFNRDYRDPKTAVVHAHLDWLRLQPDFEFAVLLHEDWEADGFYLYELCTPTAHAVSGEILQAVSSVCPILQADHADDWAAEKGVVRPRANPARRTEWPEALYLFMHKSDLCYTFEAPSDYDLSTRVDALVKAVRATVDHALADSRPATPGGGAR